MRYKYNLGENTEKEIQRIIDERFERSVEEFKKENQDVEKANHQMRKNMKKARAALRLVRGAIEKKAYKKRNKAARDTAREGAELRESEVAIETLGKIKNRFNWKSDYQFYQIARAKLRRDHQKYTKELLEEHNFRNEIIDRLWDTKEELSGISLEEEDFKSFKKGLKKVYKRGRKAAKKCRKNPSFKNHHEWRKRVKYLWYQIRILKDIWPEGLKGYANELHNLSDLLGDDHDLYDLKQRLHQIYEDSEYKDDLAKTDALVEKFSEELRLKAWPLGDKLYTEKPKDFVLRIESYWKTAHR